MKRLMIILPLAGLMAALSCSDIGFEYDNPLDSKGTNYGYKLATSTAPTTSGKVDADGIPVPATADGTPRYKPNTPVKVTATAYDDYEFLNWTAVSGTLPAGINANATPITFNINNDVNIRANFRQIDTPTPTDPCANGATPECCAAKPSYDGCTPTGTGGTFADSRDGKTYKKVAIGTQVWMAENLNYDVPSNTTDVCYNNSSDNCSKYGRLYNWATAMNNASSSDKVPSGVRGVCPVGWHLPSDAEWTALTDAVGGSSTAGTKLKARDGWNYNGNGTDDYGFAALPAGVGGSDGSFGNAGDHGSWWSATEDGA